MSEKPARSIGKDYSNMKNAQLQELLKSRSLLYSGKKAEMVARFVEYDKKKGPHEQSDVEEARTIEAR